MTEHEKQAEYKKAAELREKLQSKNPRKSKAEIQNMLSGRVSFLNILAKVILGIEIVLIFFVLILGAFSLFLRELLLYVLIVAAVAAGLIFHKIQKRICFRIPHPHACLPVLPLTLERIHRNCMLLAPWSTAPESIRVICAPVSHMEWNQNPDAESQDEHVLFFGRYSYHVSPSAYEWADIGDFYYLIFRGQGDPIAIYSAATNRPDSDVSALLRNEEDCREDLSQANIL